MSRVRSLTCVGCGLRYPADVFRYLYPKCGGFLDVEFDLDTLKAKVEKRSIDQKPPRIMERWLEFLPIEKPELIPQVSPGESVTPLIRSGRIAKKLGLKNLFLKDESAFPTGSLKDRSMPASPE